MHWRRSGSLPSARRQRGCVERRRRRRGCVCLRSEKLGRRRIVQRWMRVSRMASVPLDPAAKAHHRRPMMRRRPRRLPPVLQLRPPR